MSFYAECNDCDWVEHNADPRDLTRHEDECMVDVLGASDAS